MVVAVVAIFKRIEWVAGREIGVTPHTLRFWETKFPQLKPTRSAGGHRYYRVQDIDLLRGIYVLLKIEGFSIRGVQKVLNENGTRPVIAAGQPLVTITTESEIQI